MIERASGRKALQHLFNKHDGDWYRIVNKTKTPDVTDVYLFDEIGPWGETASEFADKLGAIETPNILLHLASPGGDVFDGITIYNALRLHKAHVTTQVESLAASIGSIIAQAGDDRVMVTGSQMMIHEAWGLSIGGADDMRKFADELDQQSAIIAAIYEENGTRSAKAYRELMRDETWFDHDEAVSFGLADRVLAPVKRQNDNEESDVEAVAAQVGTSFDWTAFVAGIGDQEVFV